MQDYSNEPINISDLPQVSNSDYQALAPSYPMLSALESMIFWGVLALGLIFAKFWLDLIESSSPLWIYLVFAFFALYSILFNYYSTTCKGFLIREKDIIYKQGVFWQKTTSVSFKRIQHIDITHGPLERLFKIASIKFFTAGGSLADLKISGLPQSDAQNLRSHILEKTGLINE